MRNTCLALALIATAGLLGCESDDDNPCSGNSGVGGYCVTAQGLSGNCQNGYCVQQAPGTTCTTYNENQSCSTGGLTGICRAGYCQTTSYGGIGNYSTTGNTCTTYNENQPCSQNGASGICRGGFCVAGTGLGGNAICTTSPGATCTLTNGQQGKCHNGQCEATCGMAGDGCYTSTGASGLCSALGVCLIGGTQFCTTNGQMCTTPNGQQGKCFSSLCEIACNNPGGTCYTAQSATGTCNQFGVCTAGAQNAMCTMDGNICSLPTGLQGKCYSQVCQVTCTNPGGTCYTAQQTTGTCNQLGVCAGYGTGTGSNCGVGMDGQSCMLTTGGSGRCYQMQCRPVCYTPNQSCPRPEGGYGTCLNGVCV